MGTGYGWVSTRDQNPDAQRDALAAAGCEEVFIDKAPASWSAGPSWTGPCWSPGQVTRSQ
jgi:hypothetical protein